MGMSLKNKVDSLALEGDATAPFRPLASTVQVAGLKTIEMTSDLLIPSLKPIHHVDQGLSPLYPASTQPQRRQTNFILQQSILHITTFLTDQHILHHCIPPLQTNLHPPKTEERRPLPQTQPQQRQARKTRPQAHRSLHSFRAETHLEWRDPRRRNLGAK